MVLKSQNWLRDAFILRYSFSREYTIKKQTWIGAEDFCIKLVFVHLMAQRYAATNSNGGSPPQPTVVMRWPPPQLEINWAIVTEVVKRLNRYTGGPERRRAAIHERFYNKLDSRWNHEDFTQAERGALAIAVSNGLAAHVVAEEMPGRSLGGCVISLPMGETCSSNWQMVGGLHFLDI